MLLRYTEKRLRAFLREIKELSTSEFPYRESEEALETLEEMFEYQLSRLGQLDKKSDEQVVQEKCGDVLRLMVIYLPILGFILRSTNVRNAFEVFGPTLRLVGDILEPDIALKERKTRLILSSEWAYSPYVYRELPLLPRFALIGLPAPESSNPFLVPLSGHELGHLVWVRNKQIESKIGQKIRKRIIENIRTRWDEYQQIFPGPPITPDKIEERLDAYPNWAIVDTWALKQAEESFCDFLGLCIFGTSFLYAFAYLTSPNLVYQRSVYYPKMKSRATNLIKAANIYKVKPPDNYASMFKDAATVLQSKSDEFRLSLADDAVQYVVEDLIHEAKGIVESSALKKPSEEEQEKEQDRIFKRLEKVVPAEHCKTLPDILNAAWKAHEHPGLWKDMEHIYKNKDSILANVLLKNIEVFYIEQIVGDENDT